LSIDFLKKLMANRFRLCYTIERIVNTEERMPDINDRLLPATQVLARYGVTAMTLWRWLRSTSLAFPAPLRINTRRYWRLRDLLEWERARAASPVAA
jgi:predicted DNA-binding transcriptional regulator AlpA